VLKLGRQTQVILGAALAVVVVLALAVGIARFRADVQDDVDAGERQQLDYRPETNDDRRSAETRVTVLGDSFSVEGAENTSPTWPLRLAEKNGWTLDLEAVGGSGYVAKSELGPALADRLDEIPRKYADLVIFALGADDSGVSLVKVKSAAKKAIDDVRAITPTSDFVIFSPFGNGTDSLPPAVTKLRDALADIAKAEGIPFVDVTEFLPSNAIADDGTHPTDKGHATLSKKIDSALQRLSLPEADAWTAA
jgi:lysophospholipase L1-like esterase